MKTVRLIDSYKNEGHFRAANKRSAQLIRQAIGLGTATWFEVQHEDLPCVLRVLLHEGYTVNISKPQA